MTALLALARFITGKSTPLVSILLSSSVALATAQSGSPCAPDWSAMGGGVNEGVLSSIEFNDGSGPALYVGGFFTQAGGVTARHVARWDGTSWSALGNGLNERVHCLAVHDDGSGTALYAGGSFTASGPTPVSGLARWNGQDWEQVGGGVVDAVLALATFDDGTGSHLFIGGSIPHANQPMRGAMLRWDGTDLSQIPGELYEQFAGRGSIRALEVFDDGTGPALYVGGGFQSVGALPVSHLARWDGASWSAVGGFDGGGHVAAFQVFDPGTGPRLYMGGVFSTVLGVPMRNVTSWDGAQFAPLGLGVRDSLSAYVVALEVYDDGDEPSLIVGGSFSLAGPFNVSGIARWNGAEWLTLGSIPPSIFHSFRALTTYDSQDGFGRRLFLGGHVDHPVTGDSNVASWGGCADQPIGTNQCVAVINSSGRAAALSATGATNVIRNDVVLKAVDLPPQTTGYWIASLTSGFVMGPGGSAGNLCLGGSIGRFNKPGQVQVSSLAGEMQVRPDLTAFPSPGGPLSVQAGESWIFQAWFRDQVSGTPTSQFSDALSISFL